MGLTVACVWVQGNVDYTKEYVLRLRSMCAKSVPQHRFVCLTDRPDVFNGCLDTIRLDPLPLGVPGWWAKVQLFNKAHAALQTGRVLYLDLDILLVDNFQLVVDWPGFAIVPDGAPNFVGNARLKTVKRYNSSVMCWDGGRFNSIYDDWDLSVTRRLWGDQDWIGEKYATLDKMPLAWFPRLSQVMTRGLVDERMRCAKAILCKKPKNLEAAKRWRWFDMAWG